MFKESWGGVGSKRRGGWPLASGAMILVAAQFVLFMPITTGCRTVLPPMPPLDLKEPGWTVHQGQAVWSLAHGEGEIAGEVLVATQKEASTFVQFTKTPFPFVIARSAEGRWEVQFPAKNKRYAGRGEPPRRLIWFYLPRALSGRCAPPYWNWSWRQTGTEWRLENIQSGESLEGYFTE